ncbi:MAG: IscS subfamily cysteine desulfurase [Acidobacteriota bacterium]|nr:IscS subfamily cysteine desulfurase [Acidobacteriota bacterium]
MKLPIYLDYHATTPVDPRVLDVMLPFFTENFGNPASRNHKFGWTAATAVENARKQVAKLINASAKEIVFTSGASESNNLAIKGVAQRYRDRGNHLITMATEHKAVLNSAKHLAQQGFTVTYVRVHPDGLVDLDDLKAALTDKTLIVSIMAANNEIGVLQPMAEIGRLCHERGALLHTDAAQATGKIPLDVVAMQIDLLSIAGHKMYAPKGVGALYVRRRGTPLDLVPIIDGGGHEGGLRSGTLNVPGIVGLGKACEICRQEMPEESRRLAALRDRLKEGLLAGLEGIHINGSLEHRLPNNLSVSFPGIDLPTLMGAVSDVALSSGSACSSGKPEPSYVLQALGVPEEVANTPLRFGLGRYTTEEEIDYCLGRVVEAVKQLRGMSSTEAA